MTTETSVRGVPVGRTGQVVLGLTSLGLLAGFAVAAMLSPDPRGYGTHTSLGLPACTIIELYGLPCPSCGLTTSFAHFVRGDFVASVTANAAGFALAALCALMIPWCWVSIGRSRLWRVESPDRMGVSLALGFLLLAIAQWVPRLL